MMNAVAEQPRPRGAEGQRPLRRAEAAVRTQALVLHRWAALHGHSARDTAARIGIAARTLSDWSHRRWAAEGRCHLRGRPGHQLSPLATEEVLDLLAACRGRLGIAALKARFGQLPRMALADLRDQYRLDHQRSMEHLVWTRPGSVWAADFTEAPLAIDGIYPHVLSIRDLASGYQLLAWPVQRAIAPVTVMALRFLFAAYGAPLVLKSDNGGHFTGDQVAQVLAVAHVTHLLSPPAAPWYNGSNEAGIGSLKTRTLAIASAFGRPECWSSDDVEAARLEANDQARPWGAVGPSPHQLWLTRVPILQPHRQAFLSAVEVEQARVLEAAKRVNGSSQQPPGCRPAAALTLTANQRATVARRAIRRVLEELGYLLTRRSVN